MKIPECHECFGVHICNAIHHRGSVDCVNFHKLVEEKLTPTNSAMDAIALCKRLFDFVNSNGELNVSESSYWYCELEKIAQQHQ